MTYILLIIAWVVSIPIALIGGLLSLIADGIGWLAVQMSAFHDWCYHRLACYRKD